MAEAGLGLAYVADLTVRAQPADGRLVAMLQEYAPTEQDRLLCSPSREQQSPALRPFVSVAKEVLLGR